MLDTLNAIRIRLWMGLKRFWWRKFTLCVIFIISTVVVAELLLLTWLYYIKSTDDIKILIGLLTAVPIFIFTILQYVRTQQIQRASYIKEFLAEFRKNEQLYTAYYDLVYSYRNELFYKVKAIVNEDKRNDKQPKRYDEQPALGRFRHLQKDGKPGSRLYHPLYFHLSLEERRLDGLLDYFNSVGFYLYNGLIEMEDIMSMHSDYIAVLADRKIIEEYLDICSDPKQWRYPASPPYFYLRFLIEYFNKYNLLSHNQERITMLNNEIKVLRKTQERIRNKQIKVNINKILMLKYLIKVLEKEQAKILNANK